MVIVSDKFLELKNREGVAGLVRVVLYLQDLGPVSEEAKRSQQLNSAGKVGIDNP